MEETNSNVTIVWFVWFRIWISSSTVIGVLILYSVPFGLLPILTNEIMIPSQFLSEVSSKILLVYLMKHSVVKNEIKEANFYDWKYLTGCPHSMFGHTPKSSPSRSSTIAWSSSL